jgi:hypothetical protein
MPGLLWVTEGSDGRTGDVHLVLVGNRRLAVTSASLHSLELNRWS